MAVQIIGANGFIGRALVSRLQKMKVQVFSSSSSEPGGIDPKNGLLCKSFSIPPEVNSIVYLAQSPLLARGIEEAAHVFRVNNQCVIDLASMAQSSGVQRFIYLSTGNVYTTSFETLDESSPLRRDNLYSMSKVHAEESLKLFMDKMDVIVVRPFVCLAQVNLVGWFQHW